MVFLAGFMIAIAAICYLNLGGIAGAVCFAVGLCAIVEFKLVLFTGQTGKLWDQKRKGIFAVKLLLIWIINFIGAWGLGAIVEFSPIGKDLVVKAQTVIDKYYSYGFWWLFALSAPCGLLVYLGVTAGRKNIVLLILCVIAFVIGGFPHCIATQAYLGLGSQNIEVGKYVVLVPITLGNVIGSWLGRFSITWFLKNQEDRNRG